MNFPSFNYSHPKDAVSFADVRNDAPAAHKIIKTHTGLSKLDEIAQSLSSGDYIPVLKAIWSERDKPMRLDWLRKQLTEHSHALLIYELAVAEFAMNPTEETLNLISFPLLIAARVRVLQDKECIDDPSLEDCLSLFDHIYGTSLDKLAKKKLNKPFFAPLSQEWKSKREEASYAKVTEMAQRNLATSPLPAPDWIAYHGLEMIMNDKIQVKSKAECDTIRAQIAQNFLKNMKF